MLRVRRLIWNRRNVEHISQHNILPKEVEEVCHGAPWVVRTKQKRLRIIGQTENGRYLMIIIAPEGGGVYYPITVRDTTGAERRRYQRWKGG